MEGNKANSGWGEEPTRATLTWKMHKLWQFGGGWSTKGVDGIVSQLLQHLFGVSNLKIVVHGNGSNGGYDNGHLYFPRGLVCGHL